MLSSFARDCKRDSLNRQSWISNLDRSLQERGFWEGLGHCVNPWYWRKALQHHVDQSYWVAYLYQVMDREDVVYDDGDEENGITALNTLRTSLHLYAKPNRNTGGRSRTVSVGMTEHVARQRLTRSAAPVLHTLQWIQRGCFPP